MSLPNTPVHLFEEHSSTLPVWWAHKDIPRTVVYLDAHLDLQQISDRHIKSLNACESIEQFKNLEAPHHLNQSPEFAYGIENFLYAAGKLGLIERLIWVTPPHIPRHYSDKLLNYIQQMDGVSFDELTGFEQIQPGVLRGRLLGLDITLCGYEQLAELNLDSDYYLDIDIDYFVKVPEDVLWTDPAEVIHSLLNQLGTPGLTTISRAVGSGFTPLPMRFVADYIHSILAADSARESRFRKLYLALKALTEGEPQKASKYSAAALEESPDCAATCLTHALVLEQLEDSDATALKRRAAALDSAYAFDLSRAASGYPNRRRRLENRQLQQLIEQLPADPEQRDELDVIALARLYAAVDQPGNALHLVKPIADKLTNYADLLLELATAILKTKQPYKAVPLLEIACGNSKTRSAATLYLGDLAIAQGQAEQALRAYRKASEFAPAWLLPLEKQITCLEYLEKNTQAERLRTLVAKRVNTLKKIVR